MTARSRRFSWTLNNYTQEELEYLKSLDLSTVKYMIFGEEVAPTTGCAHLQGYVEFASLKTLRQCKEIIGDRVHLEKSRGTAKENKVYCSKGSNIWEVGTISGQGSRNDIKKIQEMIESGATDREIASEYFGTWTRMRGAIQEYRRLYFTKTVTANYSLESFPAQWLREVEEQEVKSLILWGRSGIGKTEFAKALFPRSLMVSHMDQLKNFDSSKYEAIIFDDMDFKHIPREAQIHLFDFDNDRAIHIRYGVAEIPRGTIKIFTTNNFNGEIFVADEAIERRVRIIELVKE